MERPPSKGLVPSLSSSQEGIGSTMTAAKQKMGETRKLQDALEEGATPRDKNKLFACDICGEMGGRLDRHYQAAHKMDKEAAKARA